MTDLYEGAGREYRPGPPISPPMEAGSCRMGAGAIGRRSDARDGLRVLAHGGLVGALACVDGRDHGRASVRLALGSPGVAPVDPLNSCVT